MRLRLPPVRGTDVLLALVALALIGLVGLPLLALLPRVGGFAALPGELDALGNTVLLGLGTTLFALAIGGPMGFALARARLFRGADLLLVLPYVTPPYVTTIAWMMLANPTTGWLRPYLPVDIYTIGGMVWVLGLHLAPFVATTVRDALTRLDPAMEEAAWLAGASRLRTLVSVTIPALLPAWVASATLVFASTVASFGVPWMLGAPASDPVPVLSTRIVEVLELGWVRGRPLATSLALVLLVLGLGVPLLLRRLLAGRAWSGARSVRPLIPTDKPWATALVASWGVLAVAVPTLTLIVASLTDQGAFSTVHWARVVGDARIVDALTRSTIVSACVATATVGIGGFVAWAATRGGRGAGAVAGLARAGLAIPGSVLALALLLAFSQELRVIVLERATFTLALADTAWLLGLAWFVRFLALPVDVVGAGTRGVHPSLEEAARVAGAGPLRALRSVTIPLLAPALANAWFLVFVGAICEVTLATMLAGPRTPVLGTMLFQLQTYADPRAACVLGVGLSALLLTGTALTRRFVR
ncbi:MAG: ABC transporter permease subunit [Myxococcota bacterium]